MKTEADHSDFNESKSFFSYQQNNIHYMSLVNLECGLVKVTQATIIKIKIVNEFVHSL